MRRLYIVPRDVYFGNAVDSATGRPVTTPVPVVASPARIDEQGNHQPEVINIEHVPVTHLSIFNPTIGSHYVELNDTMLLVSTSVDHSEWAEDTWHGHPEVARLPHPIYEGTVKVKDLVADATHTPKNFKKKHLDCLTGHKHLGVAETDTVLDVAKKARAIHPLVRLSNIL